MLGYVDAHTEDREDYDHQVEIEGEQLLEHPWRVFILDQFQLIFILEESFEGVLCDVGGRLWDRWVCSLLVSTTLPCKAVLPEYVVHDTWGGHLPLVWTAVVVV